MENLGIFTCDDVPMDMQLIGGGSGKVIMKTPRLADGRIPVLVLPSTRIDEIVTSYGKSYLNLCVDDASAFWGLVDWARTVMPTGKPMNELLTMRGSGWILRVKLPERFSVLDCNGNECGTLPPNGSVVRCAVEIPFVWENATSCGVTLQLVQCKIEQMARCMIVAMPDDVEEPSSSAITPAVVSSYVPFCRVPSSAESPPGSSSVVSGSLPPPGSLSDELVPGSLSSPSETTDT